MRLRSPKIPLTAVSTSFQGQTDSPRWGKSFGMFLPVTSASDSSREGIKEEKEPRALRSLFPSLPAGKTPDGLRRYRPSPNSSPAGSPLFLLPSRATENWGGKEKNNH